MNKNFSIRQILESVHSINSDTTYIEKLDMATNSDTEKIILEAEESLNKQKSVDNTQSNEPLILNNLENERDNNIGVVNTELEKTKDSSEKIIDNKPLILNNEYSLILDNEYIEESADDISQENNFVYINEKLKYFNIAQEEKIKDLNILINKFSSQERYLDLDKKIKLYQDDNALLRKKILNLSDNETALRLQLSELSLDKQISEEKNVKFSQSEETEKEDVSKLNIKIENLLQKNNQLENELSALSKDKKDKAAEAMDIENLLQKNNQLENELSALNKDKKDKASEAMNIDQKIKFYREENTKIILDKSDIEKKLENTKSQLAVNENNKQELKVALDNLNTILAESNVESSTFINKIEDIDETKKPIINTPNEKRYKKTKHKLLNEDSLDLLVKEIFTK